MILNKTVSAVKLDKKAHARKGKKIGSIQRNKIFLKSCRKSKIYILLSKSVLCGYTFTPIRAGGGGRGGELRGPDDQIHSCHSETSYSMIPKLCDF